MKAIAGTLLSAALLGGPAVCAEPVPESFGFSLLPNAFSKNPRLSMTVFTEMTAAGRQVAPATESSPVPFVAFDYGLRNEGEPLVQKVVPTPADLERTMFRALAVNGYQPAAAGQTPRLALIYYWGSHTSMMDLEDRMRFPETHEQQVRERAMLVGGSRYRRKIADEQAFGYTFADRSPKKSFLYEQVSGDIYFVVVSAYDHADLAAGRRRLLWRTTMTVTTNGIAMRDAVPPLIMTAGNYFGRETLEPVAIHRRVRRGTVTLGPLVIVADDARTPADRK